MSDFAKEKKWGLVMICPLCSKDDYIEKKGCPYCGFVIPPDYQDDARVDVPDEDHVFFEKLGLSGEHTLPDPDSVSMDAINHMMVQMGMDPIDIGIPLPNTVVGTAEDITDVPDLDMSSMSPEDFAQAIRQMMLDDSDASDAPEPMSIEPEEVTQPMPVQKKSRMKLVGYRAGLGMRVAQFVAVLLETVANIPKWLRKIIPSKQKKNPLETNAIEPIAEPVATHEDTQVLEPEIAKIDTNEPVTQQAVTEEKKMEPKQKQAKKRVSKQTKDRLFFVIMPVFMLGLVAAGVWMVLSFQSSFNAPPKETVRTEEEYIPWTPPPETAAPLIIEVND